MGGCHLLQIHTAMCKNSASLLVAGPRIPHAYFEVDAEKPQTWSRGEATHEPPHKNTPNGPKSDGVSPT
eukprot:CAMPEP_0183602174 /NCGR_PEP_ID=MMETSP0371-20130417/180814_1 /TAXON_ID=268820 /ORGANISM="Peridinium aciculiferum, Strain PAER-2" /LENGTH=68 /DNA_ID=CAMNT_0025814269 /DNA_START=231 /DNA_END=437 /DNA_ORIENTATION=+